MVLLHQSLSGEEASHVGMVSKLVAKGQTLSGALEIAEKLASQSLPTVVLAKKAICRGNPAWVRLVHPKTLTVLQRISCNMIMVSSGRCTTLRLERETWSRA